MKKLLHPLIPLFILLILGGKYAYDVFLEGKYNEKQLLLLEKTKKDGESAVGLFSNMADMNINSAKKYIAEMGNPPSHKVLFEKIEMLDSIYQKYLQKINSNKLLHKIEEEKIYNEDYSIENLKIQTLFQEYIQEISTVDTLFAEKYQNYTFQNGESDEELATNYLNGKSIEILIHIERIKAELAHIHSESTILLAEEYGYFQFIEYTKNNVILPILHKSQGYIAKVSMIEVAPFMDSTRKNIATKEHFQTNVKYHIDEKGFFVIDEENFDIKNLQLKWFPDINHNDNHKRIYLEYGIDRTQYEK